MKKSLLYSLYTFAAIAANPAYGMNGLFARTSRQANKIYSKRAQARKKNAHFETKNTKTGSEKKRKETVVPPSFTHASKKWENNTTASIAKKDIVQNKNNPLLSETKNDNRNLGRTVAKQFEQGALKTVSEQTQTEFIQEILETASKELKSDDVKPSSQETAPQPKTEVLIPQQESNRKKKIIQNKEQKKMRISLAQKVGGTITPSEKNNKISRAAIKQNDVAIKTVVPIKYLPRQKTYEYPLLRKFYKEVPDEYVPRGVVQKFINKIAPDKKERALMRKKINENVVDYIQGKQESNHFANTMPLYNACIKQGFVVDNTIIEQKIKEGTVPSTILNGPSIIIANSIRVGIIPFIGHGFTFVVTDKKNNGDTLRIVAVTQEKADLIAEKINSIKPTLVIEKTMELPEIAPAPTVAVHAVPKIKDSAPTAIVSSKRLAHDVVPTKVTRSAPSYNNTIQTRRTRTKEAVKLLPASAKTSKRATEKDLGQAEIVPAHNTPAHLVQDSANLAKIKDSSLAIIPAASQLASDIVPEEITPPQQVLDGINSMPAKTADSVTHEKPQQNLFEAMNRIDKITQAAQKIPSNKVVNEVNTKLLPDTAGQNIVPSAKRQVFEAEVPEKHIFVEPAFDTELIKTEVGEKAKKQKALIPDVAQKQIMPKKTATTVDVAVEKSSSLVPLNVEPIRTLVVKKAPQNSLIPDVAQKQIMPKKTAAIVDVAKEEACFLPASLNVEPIKTEIVKTKDLATHKKSSKQIIHVQDKSDKVAEVAQKVPTDKVVKKAEIKLLPDTAGQKIIPSAKQSAADVVPSEIAHQPQPVDTKPIKTEIVKTKDLATRKKSSKQITKAQGKFDKVAEVAQKKQSKKVVKKVKSKRLPDTADQHIVPSAKRQVFEAEKAQERIYVKPAFDTEPIRTLVVKKAPQNSLVPEIAQKQIMPQHIAVTVDVARENAFFPPAPLAMEPIRTLVVKKHEPKELIVYKESSKQLHVAQDKEVKNELDKSSGQIVAKAEQPIAVYQPPVYSLVAADSSNKPRAIIAAPDKIPVDLVDPAPVKNKLDKSSGQIVAKVEQPIAVYQPPVYSLVAADSSNKPRAIIPAPAKISVELVDPIPAENGIISMNASSKIVIENPKLIMLPEQKIKVPARKKVNKAKTEKIEHKEETNPNNDISKIKENIKLPKMDGTDTRRKKEAKADKKIEPSITLKEIPYSRGTRAKVAKPKEIIPFPIPISFFPGEKNELDKSSGQIVAKAEQPIAVYQPPVYSLVAADSSNKPRAIIPAPDKIPVDLVDPAPVKNKLNKTSGQIVAKVEQPIAVYQPAPSSLVAADKYNKPRAIIAAPDKIPVDLVDPAPVKNKLDKSSGQIVAKVEQPIAVYQPPVYSLVAADSSNKPRAIIPAPAKISVELVDPIPAENGIISMNASSKIVIENPKLIMLPEQKIKVPARKKVNKAKTEKIEHKHVFQPSSISAPEQPVKKTDAHDRKKRTAAKNNKPRWQKPLYTARGHNKSTQPQPGQQQKRQYYARALKPDDLPGEKTLPTTTEEISPAIPSTDQNPENVLPKPHFVKKFIPKITTGILPSTKLNTNSFNYGDRSNGIYNNQLNSDDTTPLPREKPDKERETNDAPSPWWAAIAFVVGLIRRLFRK